MDEKTLLELVEKVKNKTATEEEVSILMAEIKKIVSELKEDLTTN